MCTSNTNRMSISQLVESWWWLIYKKWADELWIDKMLLAGNIVMLNRRWYIWTIMGLLPDTQNCGLRMRLECRERFPCHWLQRKLPVSDPDMHHGTCATLTRGGGENVPGITSACTTRNFTYLARGPLKPNVACYNGSREQYFAVVRLLTLISLMLFRISIL